MNALHEKTDFRKGVGLAVALMADKCPARTQVLTVQRHRPLYYGERPRWMQQAAGREMLMKYGRHRKQCCYADVECDHGRHRRPHDQ